MKNIVIVGGGTAGWITALAMQKAMPQNKITLIESKELGILGAGEGTTPAFVFLMDWLGIPVTDFITHTGATLKNGGKFKNWTGDNSYYYHNFGSINEIGGDVPASFFHNFNHSNLFYHTTVMQDVDPKELDFPALLCEQYKTPHIAKDFLDPQVNSINNFSQLAPFAIHFDAIKVADFLKEEGIKRGITLIEGKVIDIQNDEMGNVKTLILDNEINIDVDFIFDCSGFYKLINGKHYKGEWISVTDKLTVNAAQPFFLPPAEHDKIPPYTEAIARDYGWIWKIPLQHRFGCGYVYDNKYITREQAKQEIIDYLGFEPEWGGHFAFRAGYAKTPWINNCITLGVASAFLEPLEASSIWTTALMIEMICADPAQLFIKDQRIRNDFNYRFVIWMQDIVDFVYLHYMGRRTDTPFWAKFQEIKNAPETLQKALEKWEYALPRFIDYQSNTGHKPFQLSSWFEVSYGLKRIDTERIRQSFDNNGWSNYSMYYDSKKSIYNQAVNKSVNHGVMLRALGGLRETK